MPRPSWSPFDPRSSDPVDVVYVMKPRPGRIAEIDLPRPRTLDMMTTPKFGRIVEHIRSRLDKEAFI